MVEDLFLYGVGVKLHTPACERVYRGSVMLPAIQTYFTPSDRGTKRRGYCGGVCFVAGLEETNSLRFADNIMVP